MTWDVIATFTVPAGEVWPLADVLQALGRGAGPTIDFRSGNE